MGASGGARGASLVQGGAGGARAHMPVGSGRVRGTLFPGIARGTLVSDVGPRWPCGWCRVVRWGWFRCLGASGVVSRLSHCGLASAVCVKRFGGLSPFRWVCRGRRLALFYVMLCYVMFAILSYFMFDIYGAPMAMPEEVSLKTSPWMIIIYFWFHFKVPECFDAFSNIFCFFWKSF